MLAQPFVEPTEVSTVQVAPLSVEVYMFPPFTTAANFVPSAEEAIPCHSFPPPGLVVFSVQVAPLSDDVHILPPYTPATNFVPSADDARANQALFGSEAFAVQVAPLSDEVYIVLPFAPAASFVPSADEVIARQVSKRPVDVSSVQS